MPAAQQSPGRAWRSENVETETQYKVEQLHQGLIPTQQDEKRLLGRRFIFQDSSCELSSRTTHFTHKHHSHADLKWTWPTQLRDQGANLQF